MILVVYMNRVILHIDVNNAFLSWTAIDLLNKGSKYDIRHGYSVIGGDENKRSGIVLAKSTPAKKLGIETGESLYSARKKCRVLRVYSPNFSFYREMSAKLFKLICKYTPDIEVASIDECYVDYTKVKDLYGDELVFARMIQKEILDTLGFTVNVGIANNKLCAKMASDFSKPYKIHTLYSYEVAKKMWPLDVGDLFGIGKRTVPKLNRLNIYTIGDLANADVNKLYVYFKKSALMMVDKANGIDDSLVLSSRVDPKVIGNEVTLDHDVFSIDELFNYLLFLSEKVGMRLRREGKYANVLVVVLKDNTFKKFSHQRSLDRPIDGNDEIFEASKLVLREMYNGERIRLVGIRLGKFTSQKLEQVSMFDSVSDESVSIDKVVDEINIKYGDVVVRRASLLNEKIN